MFRLDAPMYSHDCLNRTVRCVKQTTWQPSLTITVEISHDFKVAYTQRPHITAVMKVPQADPVYYCSTV